MVSLDELSPERNPCADRFGQADPTGLVDPATSPPVTLATRRPAEQDRPSAR